ncbi:hypothetical protein H310_10820 [Aphanomyces invadans]|uniref:Calponin-homology (CH) domain-containing protein n=1 Tax=Aphanomyces invadans TaxID=157072 RepID=A0A024TP03_9STRA|nr:hypothetical protein H310_10820 [Aphanomyces invadans]ETV95748.1 hypothetical protein H310_10820 [Aphanomyces invadans]|eukprot:XP_008875499.1 hypothetical protein H310_10820 [Aphanomyces invadans]
MAPPLGHDEKKWLHWLNSLPLASCLLVDSFAGLQSGDVLFQIAGALQTLQPPLLKASAAAQAAHKIQQVLNVVMPHIPRHASGYQLRDPESVLDVLDGHVPAICTVLAILKTLWVQRHIRLQQKLYIDAQVDTLQHTPPPPRRPTKHPPTKTTVAVSYPAPARLVPKAFRPPSVAWNTSTLVEPSGTTHVTKPSTTPNQARPTTAPPQQPFHVQYMMDPLWITPDTSGIGIRPTRQRPKAPILALPKAYAVCRWLRSLGIALPFDRLPGAEACTAETFVALSGRAFQDGVILCQVAAVLAYRSGPPFVKSKLRPLVDQPGRFVPQGCCVAPQNAAHKRHNVQLALTFLRQLHAIPSTLVHVDDPDHPQFIADVWHLLHRVFKLSTKTNAFAAESALESSPSNERPPAKLNRLPCVTVEQIHRVREWLDSLGYAIPLQRPSLLQDALRNGSLLCHLINRMATIPTPLPVHNKPSTLHQANENVFRALSALRALRPSIAPAMYTRHAEPILKGQGHVVWGLLYCMMETFQHVPAQTAPSARPDSRHTTAALADHKVVLVEWLRTQGYLDQLDDVKGRPTFDDVQVHLQNGVLLSQLAARVTNVPLAVNLPLQSSPISKQVAWSNIQHALELLRHHPDMPQRFLWCEEKIYAGETQVLVGLLQDIRRVHDNAAAVQPKAPPPTALSDPVRPPSPAAAPISPQTPADDEDDAAGLVTCWHVDTQVHSTHQWRETDIDPSEDLFPQRHHPPDAPTGDLAVMWHVDDDVVPQPQQFKLESTLVELASWLQSMHVDGAPATLDAPTLPQFQDGLILVSLIERVNHVRRLDGVCRAPNGKRASCLHNIRKVLDLLRQKKSMPLTLLRRDKDILAGNQQVIVALLDQIRRAYGHHLAKP